jgi:hypothetical protein
MQGDESLFVPTGNVVGIFLVLVGAGVFADRWRTRLAAIAPALVAAFLPHLAPDAWLAPWLAESPRAAFFLGFAPPLAVAGAILYLSRERRSRA